MTRSAPYGRRRRSRRTQQYSLPTSRRPLWLRTSDPTRVGRRPFDLLAPYLRPLRLRLGGDTIRPRSTPGRRSHLSSARLVLAAIGLLLLVACGSATDTAPRPRRDRAHSDGRTHRHGCRLRLTAAPKATPAPKATAAPAKSAATNSNRVTSPVSPGSNASVSVTTAANASCSITVTYNSGPSKASGSGPRPRTVKAR